MLQITSVISVRETANNSVPREHCPRANRCICRCKHVGALVDSPAANNYIMCDRECDSHSTPHKSLDPANNKTDNVNRVASQPSCPAWSNSDVSRLFRRNVVIVCKHFQLNRATGSCFIRALCYSFPVRCIPSDNFWLETCMLKLDMRCGKLGVISAANLLQTCCRRLGKRLNLLANDNNGLLSTNINKSSKSSNSDYYQSLLKCTIFISFSFFIVTISRFYVLRSQSNINVNNIIKPKKSRQHNIHNLRINF